MVILLFLPTLFGDGTITHILLVTLFFLPLVYRYLFSFFPSFYIQPVF